MSPVTLLPWELNRKYFLEVKGYLFDRIFIMTDRILFTNVGVCTYEKTRGVRIKVRNPSSDEVRQTRKYGRLGKRRERNPCTLYE